jgi:hypothetical protein
MVRQLTMPWQHALATEGRGKERTRRVVRNMHAAIRTGARARCDEALRVDHADREANHEAYH